jgi:hypothetical protein
VLLLAVIAAIGSHVAARHRALIHHEHFGAASRTLRQRYRRRWFAAGAEFEPRGPLHLRFDPCKSPAGARCTCFAGNPVNRGFRQAARSAPGNPAAFPG